MARANTTNHNSTKTINKAGGSHYAMTPEVELYLATCASFLEDKYYENANERVQTLRGLVKQCDGDFVCRLASYARNEMNLRSVSILLLVEAAIAGHSVRRYVPQVVQRADELAEVLARFTASTGQKDVRKIPASLKRGLSDAFNKFNEYHFGKYKGNSRSVTLKDAVCLVHPKPANEAKSALFKKILDDQLAIPQTWETYISANGSTAENWNHIAPQMGIFALLRNLRKMEELGAEEALNVAYSRLQDKDVIAHSRLLPFRFLAAVNEVSRQRTQDVLRIALELSLVNVPRLEGETMIWVDNSGSMSNAVSSRSKMTCIDVASVLGAMTSKISGGRVGTFGDRAQLVTNMSSLDTVLTNAKKIKNCHVGHSTNAWATIDLMIRQKIKVDRVVLLSDMQCYASNAYYYGASLQERWNDYLKTINPEAKLYSVDLAGYGGSQFALGTQGVVTMAGFSDKILGLFDSLEKQTQILDVVKAYNGPRSRNEDSVDEVSDTE